MAAHGRNPKGGCGRLREPFITSLSLNGGFTNVVAEMFVSEGFSLVSLGYLCVNSVPDSFTIARQHGGLRLISVTEMSARGW